MARLHPSQFPGLREDGGLYRELDVLERLRHGLPEGYEIFHEVTWHNVREGRDRHGEIDIVVLSPLGNLLLMEVKAGEVLLREGGVFKRYGSKERDVALQCKVQYSAMMGKLKLAGLHPRIANCLVLPDYRVPAGQVVSIPRERIIGADEYDLLAVRVQEMLAIGGGASVEELRRFLCSEFRISPSIANLRDQLHGATERLSDGLATWVPRISHPCGAVRVQATAGSGKTQLALRLLENAVAAGESALYVCFNRPLADCIASLAPARAEVASFHELAVEYYRRNHGEPDFGDSGVFLKVAGAYHEDSENFAPKYELLVIDEGQDFDPQWVASLLPLLKPSGRLYLLEDEAQRLYERDAFELSDAVTLACNDNHRSPRAVCQVVNALGLVSPAIVGKSPYQGELPRFRRYASEAELFTRTAEAVDDLLQRGFELQDIVILTGHGLGRSRLLNSERIGRFSTRKFTGRYTREGNPQWSDGEITVESIYRFKGQSAPAVILSEIDFTELTAQERRKLFVGMTRARLDAQLVLSSRAEACIACELE